MLEVVLVDDHDALREGLEVLLERRGVRVLASAGSVEEALSRLAELQPEVVVVDLDLPDGGGLGLVRRLRAERSAAKVLIYTGSQDGRTLADALESGAEGIVLKPGGLAELVEALRAVARGERYVDPAIGEILAAAPGHLLTKREREVFGLLAEGLSGEEIATRLTLSPETVRTHVRNGMKKLQARTRTEAVVRAMEEGEIETGEHPRST